MKIWEETDINEPKTIFFADAKVYIGIFHFSLSLSLQRFKLC